MLYIPHKRAVFGSEAGETLQPKGGPCISLCSTDRLRIRLGARETQYISRSYRVLQCQFSHLDSSKQNVLSVA
jgi:hypothetical protein